MKRWLLVGVGLCLSAALLWGAACGGGASGSGGDPSAQIAWGPTVGDLTGTSVRLAWYTNTPDLGEVEIGGQTVAGDGPVQAHQVQLQSLQPGRTYRYRLHATTPTATFTGPWHEFTTPAAGLTDFDFCAYGDTRSDAAAHRQVVEALVKCRPRLVLHTGDLVDNGADLAGWKLFFPVIAHFSGSVPFYPCVGNHEDDAELYDQLLPLPAGQGLRGHQWYSAVFGSCQIISLDSDADQAAQGEWLRQLLAQPRPAGVAWRLAMFHAPPYTSGPHEPDAGALQYWCPLLENGGVDLVFNGHNHYCERSLHGGLNYLTVGGGGAPLYEASLPNPFQQSFHSVLSFARVRVSAQSLQVTALDTQLRTLDTVTVTHPPAATP